MAAEARKSQLDIYQSLITLTTTTASMVEATRALLDVEEDEAANNHGGTERLTAGQVQDIRIFFARQLQEQLQRLTK